MVRDDPSRTRERHSSMKVRLAVSCFGVVLVGLSACGDDTGTGGASDSSTSATTSTSSTHAATSGTSASGSTTATGTSTGTGGPGCTNGANTVGSCTQAGMTACVEYPMPYTASDAMAACAAPSGTFSDQACDRSASNFIGCCELGYPSGTLCYFDDASQTTNYHSTCDTAGGTWCP